MKKVNIVYYAILREKIGESETIYVNQDLSAKGLLELLAGKYPETSNIFKVSRVACGSVLMAAQDVILQNEVISILPPSSGG